MWTQWFVRVVEETLGGLPEAEADPLCGALAALARSSECR
jgi:hypothetical protein